MDINLGLQAKILRTEQGLTLHDLAAKVGVSASTLSRFERGSIDVLLSTVLATFEALGSPLCITTGGGRRDLRDAAMRAEFKHRVIELIRGL